MTTFEDCGHPNHGAQDHDCTPFQPSAFEDAARKAGPKDWPAVNAAFVAGAVWTRDHLAEQEPSDAEVEAAFQAFIRDSNKQAIRNELAQPDLRARPEPVNTRQSLRAALCAAARIRKEQER